MKKQLATKGRSDRVNKLSTVKKRIDSAQETITDVDSINRAINNTLYIRDNLAVDLKNFSLIIIKKSRDLL